MLKRVNKLKNREIFVHEKIVYRMGLSCIHRLHDNKECTIHPQAEVKSLGKLQIYE
jgi:hypothetical protein